MIKLLIVDDSALMRRLLTEAFRNAGDFDVVVARDGEEALSMLEEARPDVITLDVNMPGLNGLETLDRIMLQRPCPVVMLSALTTDGADVTLEAMQLGAVDFVAKPKGAVSLRIDDLAEELVGTVRSAAAARVRRSHRLAERLKMSRGAARTPVRSEPPSRVSKAKPAGTDLGLALVGSSTGGPPALDELLSSLPDTFPWPVLVAQHMPASFTGALARRLDRLCALTVVEADRSMRLEPGVVYIGRGDADMVVSRRGDALFVMPAPESDRYRWHPSVDRLVDSAMAHVPAERLAGILLTGMGNDGATAMTRMREAGGWTVAESEQTAVVWGMPGELAKAGGAVVVADLPEIAGHLLAAVGR